MCGIIGAFGPSIPPGWLDASLSFISHRGPDSDGSIKLNNSLSMAAVRLAMTDPLPRSNQPMSDLNSGDILTFNGEIYNYKHLKSELVSLGISFRTESDTEVLLYWLNQFGASRINELQGMFALAYYSATKNTVLLSRDPLGKKPLYWKIDASRQNLAWSSSATVLAGLDSSPQISKSGLSDYLSIGYILDPNSAFENIASIMPGEVVEIDLSDLQRIPGFHKVATPVKGHKNLRKAISEAVMRRIEGQEKVALSLSGGVDSAIIALILAENGINAKCFSASWEDTDKDRYNVDARHAEVIAGNLNLDFQTIKMISSSELESEIRKFLKAMEEPNNNPSGVSMMRLYQSISEQNYRLVLTGDGADEIFAGYERHTKSKMIPNLLKLHSERITNWVLNADTPIKSRIAALIGTQTQASSYETWLIWHKLFSEREVRGMIGLAPWSLRSEILDLSNLSTHAGSTESLVQRDREIWLPMESNRKLDRVSMFYSIEARSPFQDEEVVSLGKEIMSNSRYRKLEKVLLKESFPELESLGVRPDKAGFVSPLGHWLRENPQLVAESLNCLVQMRILVKEEAEAWLATPQLGDFKLLKKLWALTILGIWMGDIKNDLGAVFNE